MVEAESLRSGCPHGRVRAILQFEDFSLGPHMAEGAEGCVEAPFYFYYYFLKLNLINFTYFGLCWVFVAAHGLSLVAASGATLCCGAWASHYAGLPCGAWAVGMRASVVVVRGLSSCGS